MTNHRELVAASSGRWRRKRARRGYFAALLGVALGPAIAGCGDGLAQVSGLVTIDGEPLSGGSSVRATVVFEPDSRQGRPAVGILDENGQYWLYTGSRPGAEPGEYVATCSATQIIPSASPHGTPGGKRITDPKYASAQTSGFRFTVQPGKNEFNLHLESSPSDSSRRPNR